VTFNVAGGAATVTALAAEFQAQFTANATLQAASFAAAYSGGFVKITANAAVNFRINLESRQGGVTMDAGFGVPASAVVSTGSLMSLGNPVRTDAAGTSQTVLGANDVFSFAGLRNLNDAQTISVSTTDSAGVAQSVNVSLTGANASSLDLALAAINAGLQGSTSAALREIVAVKENNAAGAAQGIRFISKDTSFSVTVGAATNETNANPVGLYDGTGSAPVQSKTYISTTAASTAAADISTSLGAKAAVIALGSAVKALGSAQAAVGKSQNQLGYAVGLANSQIGNFSAAQSQIRDADIAAEAANLTKASVLQQAAMAAMAQANTAPQAVLALLRG
jgi:flagellin